MMCLQPVPGIHLLSNRWRRLERKKTAPKRWGLFFCSCYFPVTSENCSPTFAVCIRFVAVTRENGKSFVLI